MMLEIALEAEEEWDSSLSWEDLARLHVGRFTVLVVLVAEKVERAMNQQMHRMIFKRHAFLRGLSCTHAPGKDNVPEQQFPFSNICPG